MDVIERVFGSADIFPIIVHVEGILSASDLYSLARVAHIVSDAALDALWSVLPTAFHALALLPCFGLSEIHSVYGGTYGLMRSPICDDWVAFDRYAYRIRRIQRFYSTSGRVRDRDDIDVNVFVLLHQSRPEISLFPSLRTLQIPRRPGTRRSYRPIELTRGVMIPLLSERLFSLQIHSHDQFVVEYLSHLCHKPNNLRHLRILGPTSEDSLPLIARFSDLELLELNFRQTYRTVPFEAYLSMLKDVASLQHLTTLALFPPYRDWNPQSTPLSFSFSGLRKLAVSGDLESAISICGTAPTIEHFVLDAREAPMLDAWTTFFLDLKEKCKALRHLEIRHKHFEKFKPLRVADYLGPLLSLKLESLRIFSEESTVLHLSDNDVCKIASSLQSLKHVDLFTNGTYLTTASSPTLQSVVTFLTFCPNIQFLRLNIGRQVLNRYKNNTDTVPTVVNVFT